MTNIGPHSAAANHFSKCFQKGTDQQIIVVKLHRESKKGVCHGCHIHKEYLAYEDDAVLLHFAKQPSTY